MKVNGKMERWKERVYFLIEVTLLIFKVNGIKDNKKGEELLNIQKNTIIQANLKT